MKNNIFQSNLNSVAFKNRKFWLKAFILFFFSAFMIQNAKAQYFSTLYGDYGNPTTSNEYLTDGITTAEGNYLMTGHDEKSNDLIITLTDKTGSPIFNNRYPLSVLFLGSNYSLIVTNSKCIQHPNSTPMNPLYIVICEAYDLKNFTFYLYYLDINNTETIINNLAISIPSNDIKLGNIALGNTGIFSTDFYITGSTNNWTEEKVFAARIDISTTTPYIPSYSWDGIYDVTNSFQNGNRGMDIIVNPTNNDELVVGQAYSDAFILPINKSNGIPSLGIFPSYQAIFWGYMNNNGESFTSITTGSKSPNGFVISGNTQENITNDMWAVKINGSTYAQVWSTYRGHSSGSPTENYGIVERQNTMGDYEYYQVGTVIAGGIFPSTATYTDMIVYKIDDAGNGVSSGQFSYLSGQDWSRGKAIDIDNVNTDIGLTIFGTTQTSTAPYAYQTDMNMVKAYYNGVSCSSDERNFGTDHTSIITSSPRTINIPIYDSRSPATISSALPISLNDGLICSVSSDPAGNNNLVIQKEPKNGGLIFSPNPFDKNNNTSATIEITGSNSREITIGIYDMLGREYYNGKMMIEKNKSRLTIDLSNIPFVPGMYMLRTDDTENHRTTMIQIK